MFILQFLFFIFIIILIVGLFVVLRIFLTIRRTADKFRNFASGGTKQQTQGNGASKTYKKTNPLIIDTRSEEVRNRKIFSDKVGDYVKFKEIK